MTAALWVYCLLIFTSALPTFPNSCRQISAGQEEAQHNEPSHWWAVSSALCWVQVGVDRKKTGGSGRGGRRGGVVGKDPQGSQLPLCEAHISHAVCRPGVAPCPVQDPTLGVGPPRIEEAEGSGLWDRS